VSVWFAAKLTNALKMDFIPDLMDREAGDAEKLPDKFVTTGLTKMV